MIMKFFISDRKIIKHGSFDSILFCNLLMFLFVEYFDNMHFYN